jgi:hypothetical protein
MAFKRSPVRSWSAPPVRFPFIFLVCLVAQVSGAVATRGSAPQAEQSDPAAWSLEEKEEFLRNAKIIKTVGVLEGATQSIRVTLQSDRGTHDAQIQTIDEAAQKFEGVGGQWELNFKDTYKFNLAAYLMDRILDLNMIPATVERKVDGRNAAVTWWIDNVLMDEKKRVDKDEKPPLPVRAVWNRQIQILLVFDQLIANRDRNISNIVITKNWNVWLIDHTRAFRMYKDLPEPEKLAMCDRALLENLRELNKPFLMEKLGTYLTDMELDGLLARRDKIVGFFDDKIAREGESAVLFDYLIMRRTIPQGRLD